MQQLFMECVSSVKKDIQKRNSVHFGYKNNKIPEVADGHLEDVQKFSDGDRRKVIDKIMSSENVLLFLYDKMFPTDIDPARSPVKLQRRKPDLIERTYPEIPVIKNIDKFKVVENTGVANLKKRP